MTLALDSHELSAEEIELANILVSANPFKVIYNTYPVTIVFNNNVLMSVKVVLVLIVFVSLPNKTCSQGNWLHYFKRK